ncbi:hypothetical protein [Rheinheimera sp. 1928-s]|uniref:alpha/beta hydrolase family protein n=1 Tax=Rheinheimera sp. 1928-s TaxID=3033803 RepID=UPI00261C3DB6|nr:hypothetical protein [Rheinheimera sp. 1928-s]MDF3125298.1 hypothetical protein [Rheinheimera sp. 1928-s]
MSRPLIALILGIFMLGCSEPELPAANPLSVEPGQLSQIPYLQQGQLTVVTERDLILPASEDYRELTLSVFYPQQGDQYPIIFFSHGNWSSKDKYDKVIQYWVSHGYVVVAPNHLDCCSRVRGILNSLRYGNFGLIEHRVKDFNYLINQYSLVEQLLPGLKDKADLNHIALAGHSFGAFTAQQFGGAGSFNTDNKSYHFYQDGRVKAIVALSPPGPMFDEITTQSWQQLSTPTFNSTGTWDIDKYFFTEWQLHQMAFDTALAGNNYMLVTQGADHYLGNLICRPERDVAPQQDALMLLNATSTAFLAAYLKQDQQAKAFLQSGELRDITSGFSVLEYR